MAATLFTHYPDERHYTDGAIAMLRGDDDWLTPHDPDGSIRLKKPILSYWVTARSCAALGVTRLVRACRFCLRGAAFSCLPTDWRWT